MVDVARLTNEEKSSFEAISSNTKLGRVVKLIVPKGSTSLCSKYLSRLVDIKQLMLTRVIAPRSYAQRLYKLYSLIDE